MFYQPGSQYPPRMRRPPTGTQFPPTGNVVCVDSLEHALSMPTGYHSENVYFDSNQNLMYRIYTNELGEKSYLVFELKLCQPKQEPNPVTITAEDFEAYNKRLSTLENLLGVNNGKSNVSVYGGSENTNAEPAGQSNTQ